MHKIVYCWVNLSWKIALNQGLLAFLHRSSDNHYIAIEKEISKYIPHMHSKVSIVFESFFISSKFTNDIFNKYSLKIPTLSGFKWIVSSKVTHEEGKGKNESVFILRDKLFQEYLNLVL